jgi:hypothetical protein
MRNLGAGILMIAILLICLVCCGGCQKDVSSEPPKEVHITIGTWVYNASTFWKVTISIDNVAVTNEEFSYSFVDATARWIIPSHIITKGTKENIYYTTVPANGTAGGILLISSNGYILK